LGGYRTHRTVVHANEEDGKLGQVADVGSVVVVGPCEGQVDKVVEQKNKR